MLSLRKIPNVIGRAPQQDCLPRLRADIMCEPGTLCMTRLFAEESMRMLNVMDEDTRECLCINVERRINARKVR